MLLLDDYLMVGDWFLIDVVIGFLVWVLEWRNLFKCWLFVDLCRD